MRVSRGQERPLAKAISEVIPLWNTRGVAYKNDALNPRLLPVDYAVQLQYRGAGPRNGRKDRKIRAGRGLTCGAAALPSSEVLTWSTIEVCDIRVSTQLLCPKANDTPKTIGPAKVWDRGGLCARNLRDLR